MVLGLDIDGVIADFISRYFTQEKKSALIRKLGIELFVDDRYENCEDVAMETNAAVLMPHRPYNQAFSHPRVRCIGEFDELWEHVK